MAVMAQNWLRAREHHAAELIEVEGEESYYGQQTFFKVEAEIAQQRRLSRSAFHAVKKQDKHYAV